MSFAQFEREVTGERIRDKITASKKKGLWMGGIPPLGYDVRDRKLVPNSVEAKLVRYIFGKDGRALSPWHTTKRNGRRYRYYIPQRDAKEYAGASGLPRLPAAELESAVLQQLRSMMRQPVMISEIVPQALALDERLDEAQVTVAMTQLDVIWDQLFPAEQQRIVQLLVERVIVSATHIELRLRANGIGQMAMELQPARVIEEALA